MPVARSPFGLTPSGQQTHLFTCVNANQLVLKVCDYGALVVAVEAPDRQGRLANLTLGFDSLEGYLQRHPYFGATVGRCCNRIANGRFELEGATATLAANNGRHHLHGGIQGFDRAVWSAESFEQSGARGVRFTRVSPDGEEGYPGSLRVEAIYALTDANELRVTFNAETDRATHVNLTNHSYWNLSGVGAVAGAATILQHELQIEADQFVPVDETLIPTGQLADVAGTPLDFRSFQAVGREMQRLQSDPLGYDHCYVVRGSGLRRAATVRDPASGRVLEIETTQPGIQLYTGNFLDGAPECGGFPRHAALCLETQHFPDTPNQPNFPSTALHPGQRYHQVTVHRFSTQ